eukprot:SAG31_NODE_15013_length_775_cov_1.784024_1_plen_65_part_01
MTLDKSAKGHGGTTFERLSRPKGLAVDNRPAAVAAAGEGASGNNCVLVKNFNAYMAATHVPRVQL